MKTAHQDFKCYNCNEYFGKQEDWKQHSITCIRKKDIPCELCSRKFTTEFSLQYHLKKVHAEVPRPTFQKCNRCEHTTNSENGICWRHEEIQELQQKWRKCGYPECITYTSKNFCSHHEEIQERESKWRKCSKCETFTTEGLCSSCRTSVTSSNQEKSAEIVDRIRKGECCEFCEKNFVNSSMLYVHLWNTHDVRTFDGEIFEDEEDFLDHVKSISQDESDINKYQQPIKISGGAFHYSGGGGGFSRQKFEPMAAVQKKSKPVMVHLGFPQKSPNYPIVLAKTGPELEIVPLNSIQCEKCGVKNLESEETLKEHSCKMEIFKVTSESDDNFPCEICDKSFSTQDILKKHEKEHYAYVDTKKSVGPMIVVNLGELKKN